MARWPSSTPASLSGVERGGKILRRQDLPKEAFTDLETVKRCLVQGFGDCLRVIAVSHPQRSTTRPEGGQPHATRKGTRAVYRGGGK